MPLLLGVVFRAVVIEAAVAETTAAPVGNLATVLVLDLLLLLQNASHVPTRRRKEGTGVGLGTSRHGWGEKLFAKRRSVVVSGTICVSVFCDGCDGCRSVFVPRKAFLSCFLLINAHNKRSNRFQECEEKNRGETND